MLNKNIILLIAGITLLFVSCTDRGLKEDAQKISDAMCKNISVMNDLRKANPMDTVLVQKLQNEAKDQRIEMTILYQEFNQKYGEKTKDEKFNKKFAKELRKAMLKCPNLSPEDKAQFEKELEE